MNYHKVGTALIFEIVAIIIKLILTVFDLSFDEVLSGVESLTVEDQNLLFEIIRKRRIEDSSFCRFTLNVIQIIGDRSFNRFYI